MPADMHFVFLRRPYRADEGGGLLHLALPMNISTPYNLQDKYGYEDVVMVGDGATDLEARLEGAASLFIG
jgi:hypothetical protein